MKTVYRTLILVFFLLTEVCFAQKVTNISAEQVGQTIQVSYNLETESPCTVSLFYSTDNVSTWQGPLKKVSGDVGEKISNGIKKITWDVLNEMDQLKFSSVVFKVDARKPGLKEVKIGNQIWSAENLNIDRYSNGDIIPQVTDATEWSSLKTGAWCYYNNDSSNGPVYGKLYNWYAVADPRALCPNGWHVPNYGEWTLLINYLGGVDLAGGKMKEKGYIYWVDPYSHPELTGISGYYPYPKATNSSGFTAMPVGFRYGAGNYFHFGRGGLWWSATQDAQTEDVNYIKLYYTSNYVTRSSFDKSYGLSIRCIKD
jgi:uncharacterized protein (TIGR02145 family)